MPQKRPPQADVFDTIHTMRRDKKFWNTEYTKAEHLRLSKEPSEDLQKFSRWLERRTGRTFLNQNAHALDLGCGNGRNLIYLAQTFGMRGEGYDISETAIAEAVSDAEGLPLSFAARSISEPIPLPDASVSLALDMMASHVLREGERAAFLAEIVRVLRPGGWLFFKSFLLDEDLNAKRLLRDHPAGEKDAYIHPEFGWYEHVWMEESLRAFFEPHFTIHKIEKSHQHMRRGRAHKRRSITAYMEKTDTNG